MQYLPKGTVTLLFTDIEGSTFLLHQLGERYPNVLSECRHLLRTAFQQFNGREVDTQGDCFFVAFARATDAVSAAVGAQRTLATYDWPNGMTVSVRMGLHTGEPIRTAEGYVGLDVHHAARIMSVGHGAQVLLSHTTRELVKHDLLEGVSLLDMGEHRLKDLQHPSHLFQLVIAGLPADFPPLKTLDTHPNNLPVQPTPLIGRDQQVAAILRLLSREEVRLLTLTGPGGTGKTRLGLQVAAELSDTFTDGVYFVNLAPLSDPTLVVPTIAQTLDIKEVAGQSLLDLLKGALHWKHLLLLLDNFEQVVDAAVDVAALLAACPNLKVLVTSRMSLHVRGEQEFAVPPLTVPDPKRLPDLVSLSQYEAVALFIARAQAVKPEFQVSNANAPAIAEICVRLDGLPLAIELAAARIKLLPPQALLARLGQRLVVLMSGARDAPARQQTLRNTIKWSYDLLDAQEQRLFRWLSVFVGGCTLEAIEAVYNSADDEKGDILNTVYSLIDKSLVQQREQESGEPQLTMLETVREYALERLIENEEAEVCQRAHALSYLVLAEEAEPHLKGAQQVLWWKRLEREQENLRAALSWLIGQEEGELALRLSAALWWFWNIRGYWSEGGRWLEAALGLPRAQARTAKRAKALYGADTFAWRLGGPTTRSKIEESVAIYRELGEKHGLAEVLSWLGLRWTFQSNLAAARMPLDEAVALAREVGDPWLLAKALRSLGNFMRELRDVKSAHHFLEESVTLYREVKDQRELSFSLRFLAETAMLEGNPTQATALAQESLALARELEGVPDIIRTLYLLAGTRSLQGDVEQAVVTLEESLALARDLGDRSEIALVLLALGGIVLYQGDLLRAEMCVKESLTLFRELRMTSHLAVALTLLGEIRLLQGDLTQARAICTEAVLQAKETEDHYSVGVSLIALAKVTAAEGQPEQAARLFGAAEPRINPRTELDPFERADYERAVEGVREQLAEKAFAAAWAEGRTLTLEQVLAAQEPTMMFTPTQTEPASPPKAPTTATYPDGLTAREVEVLRLVAQGLTNEQVAEQLVIKPAHRQHPSYLHLWQDRGRLAQCRHSLRYGASPGLILYRVFS